MRTSLAIAITLTLVVGAAGCSSSPTSPSTNAPQITSLEPTQVVQNLAPQLVTIKGLDFVSGLTLMITDPTGAVTTFTGPQVQAVETTSFQVTATFASAGLYSLLVKNPTGDASPPFVVVVQSTVGGTAPVIESITPASTTRSSSPQVVGVRGSNFLDALLVTVIDPSGKVTVLSTAVLDVVTPTSFQVTVTLDQAGTYVLFVTNPTGEVSNSVTITVL